MAFVRGRTLANGIGLWSAVFLLLSTVAAIVTVVPARSGPFCLADCIGYPYADIARFYPADYRWMIGSLLGSVALVPLAAAALDATESGRRVLGVLGVAFATLTATVLSICYLTQLHVVQPSVLAGESDGIAILTQYNDHGLFIALESLGYLALSVTLALIGLALPVPGRAGTAVRWTASLYAVAVIGAFVVIEVALGVTRSYYFEVISISANWVGLLALGVVACLTFRRLRRT